jgi:hypothetical protein
VPSAMYKYVPCHLLALLRAVPLARHTALGANAIRQTQRTGWKPENNVLGAD